MLIYLHVGGTYKARSVDIKIDFPQDKHKMLDAEINLFAYILMALFNLEREVSLLFSFVGWIYSGSCSGFGNLALKRWKFLMKKCCKFPSLLPPHIRVGISELLQFPFLALPLHFLVSKDCFKKILDGSLRSSQSVLFILFPSYL